VYNVKLKAVTNPDYLSDLELMKTDWEKPLIDTSIKCETLQKCSEACRRFISVHDLGGGNWAGGEITVGDKVVGKVSYNGRIWDTDGNEIKP